MASGVYAILNVANGMRYVGSSKYLEERMEHHFHMLELGKHHNYLLQKSYDASGDVWAWITLELCGFSRLEQTEQKWINRAKLHGRLFNLDLDVDRSQINDTDK